MGGLTLRTMNGWACPHGISNYFFKIKKVKALTLSVPIFNPMYMNLDP